MLTLRRALGFAAILVAGVTAAATAQSPARIDTSGWTTYRNATMGFEVRHPPTWRVTQATGTSPEMVMLGKPVILGGPSPAEPRQVPVQFWVQRDINPAGLSIDAWYADQLKRLKVTTPPPATSTVLGGRRAIRHELARSDSRHYDVYTTLNTSDIFQANFNQPLERSQVDPMIEAILSTVKLIE